MNKKNSNLFYGFTFFHLPKMGSFKKFKFLCMIILVNKALDNKFEGNLIEYKKIVKNLDQFY